MGEAGYERLSALDAAFLSIERETTHMHVGGIVLLDARDVRNEHGGVDFSRVRDALGNVAAQLPRLRQRLLRVPGVGHWVWVEDPHFNLDFHVRHAALPRPGGHAQLMSVAGRIFSQRLDRSRPLWEMWILEGLAGDRFALVAKLHHCMMDGVGAVSLLGALVAGGGKRFEMPEVKPAPTRGQVLVGELRHRFEGVKTRVVAARAAFEKVRLGLTTGAGDLTRGLSEALMSGLLQVSPTPLNPEELSPHRRFETLRLELADVKRVKGALGGTVNDVVLATVTGALRRYLVRHGVDLAQLERFRALLPTNVRKPGGAGAQLGNRVSLMIAPLPVQESDPRLRLERVRTETEYLKSESSEIASAEFLEKLDDDLGLGLVNATFKLAVKRRSFNVVVTNVAGPPMALKLFGANLLGVHALVPLFDHQGLGIAILSYHGGLYWGFNADWDAVPDLPDLVEDVRASFAELLALASPAERDASAPA